MHQQQISLSVELYPVSKRSYPAVDIFAEVSRKLLKQLPPVKPQDRGLRVTNVRDIDQ